MFRREIFSWKTDWLKKKKVAIYPHTKRGGDVGCGKESMRFRRQSQRIQHTCLEVPEVVEREKMENI